MEAAKKTPQGVSLEEYMQLTTRHLEWEGACDENLRRDLRDWHRREWEATQPSAFVPFD